MKNILCLMFIGLNLTFSAQALADELINMSDGSTCWKNESGHVYGCSGGASTVIRNNSGAINPRTGEVLVPTGDGGYTGTRDGRHYAPAGPNGVIDTTTGKFIPTN